MAIYRPPKPRWPLAVATLVVGLLIGLALGFALGGQEFDAADAAEEIRGTLSAAAGSLEVAGIEYAEAVEGGEVQAEAEYRGATDAVESSRSQYAEVEAAVEGIAPGVAGEITDQYDEIEGLMSDLADEQEVDQALGELEELLSGS
jgi:hypothetical protein